MTVNVVALTVSFIAALVNGHMPLNVLQLLWVNLVMDAMGALGTYHVEKKNTNTLHYVHSPGDGTPHPRPPHPASHWPR